MSMMILLRKFIILCVLIIKYNMNELIGKWKGSIQLGEVFIENELDFIDDQNVKVFYSVKQPFIGNMNIGKDGSQLYQYKYNKPHLTISYEKLTTYEVEGDTMKLFLGRNTLILIKQKE